jgi:hypothetical protein
VGGGSGPKRLWALAQTVAAPLGVAALCARASKRNVGRWAGHDTAVSSPENRRPLVRCVHALLLLARGGQTRRAHNRFGPEPPCVSGRPNSLSSVAGDFEQLSHRDSNERHQQRERQALESAVLYRVVLLRLTPKSTPPGLQTGAPLPKRRLRLIVSRVLPLKRGGSGPKRLRARRVWPPRASSNSACTRRTKGRPVFRAGHSSIVSGPTPHVARARPRTQRSDAKLSGHCLSKSPQPLWA